MLAQMLLPAFALAYIAYVASVRPDVHAIGAQAWRLKSLNAEPQARGRAPTLLDVEMQADVMDAEEAKEAISANLLSQHAQADAMDAAEVKDAIAANPPSHHDQAIQTVRRFKSNRIDSKVEAGEAMATPMNAEQLVQKTESGTVIEKPGQVQQLHAAEINAEQLVQKNETAPNSPCPENAINTATACMCGWAGVDEETCPAQTVCVKSECSGTKNHKCVPKMSVTQKAGVAAGVGGAVAAGAGTGFWAGAAIDAGTLGLSGGACACIGAAIGAAGGALTGGGAACVAYGSSLEQIEEEKGASGAKEQKEASRRPKAEPMPASNPKGNQPTDN